MSNSTALFACSRCFTRHPFEELSPGQQLCKECRGAFPVVKCTYCRSEFQQTNKLSTSTICKKCEVNVKQYGKPTACEYCNIIAAFIGNKCQRCTNSERKYGPPVTCEQCKQKCAFDRKDEDKKNSLCMKNDNFTFNIVKEDGELSRPEDGRDSKVDGKLLCWLCTLSFKRALAKTKQSDAERRAHNKMMAQKAAKNKEVKLRSHNKRPNRVDVTKIPAGGGQDNNNAESNNSGANNPPPPKMPRVKPPGDPLDPNSSDHVVAMTQLKEQMASLQKQLTMKDNIILSKDKMITELKAKHFTSEAELRNKMNNVQKDNDKKVEMLHMKIKTLQKEVATLSKGNKKDRLKQETKDGNSGSGTDSPSIT
ncbi:protein FAM76A isoform X2 [Macrosteles quadrilineatus]|uniref:protein FAM76A isoform X2 n=1 Tax=Macrosteles quadrilineatus TaxID=74068 RepID=UPI0023E22F17|nr:protein FAM76A isoform X2 [Macrosteles quadrilineatus]